VALFFSGVVFAHQVVFPAGLKFLIGLAGSEMKPVLSMGAYFSFSTKLLIAFGTVFEIPLFVLVFSRLGLIGARDLVRWWKYAILGAFVIGAILTPPDLVSQALMAIPIVLLYAVSIVVAYLFGKK